jgi:glycine/D-amino acid oxidase-like deaminating enzyme
MPVSFGKRAVVVGAGVRGLCAARVLADRFEPVVVLERDTLPKQATPRPGTSLVKSPSVYREPALQQRVMTAMAED